MIVVDANILIYFLIKCEQSPLVQKLRGKYADWRTAALCLHETLNVLTSYRRRDVLTLAQCWALLGHAERLIKVAQCDLAMLITDAIRKENKQFEPLWFASRASAR